MSSISNINDWEKDNYPCVCSVCEKEFPLCSDHFSQLENKLYAHGKQIKGIRIPERYIFKKFIKNEKN